MSKHSLLARTFTEEEFKDILLDSYMAFLQYFFKLKTGEPFALSNPVGRQSHFLTIRDELEKVFKLESSRLIINVPPGYAKSTMLVYFIAWCLAKYPDSNFLYISYAFELAEKHTSLIKDIITMPSYRYYFGVELRTDSKSRSSFQTLQGGCVRAFGSSGAVTGFDGGKPNLSRFSGMVLLDDPIQPDKGHSEVTREAVIRNYNETIKYRARGTNVPIVLIGQRVHEGDLSQFLLDGKDGDKWENVVLQCRDPAGNILYPEYHGKVTQEEREALKETPDELHKLIITRAREWSEREEQCNRFAFWAQQQQRPVADGAGIFLKDDFVITDLEPKIISTFIAIDTAESCNSWSDFTAMGFFGIYRIEARGIDTGLYGLHWLDHRELRIEPKDLEAEFFDFYSVCMRHTVKPMYCVIEKASAGVTLISTLKGIQGIKILDLQRTGESKRIGSGSKTVRYYVMQPYVASKRISFTRDARHVDKCINHMCKITSNEAHAHDDTCDVLQSAIQCALIEGTLLPKVSDATGILKEINRDFNQSQQLQKRAMQWDY